MSLSLLTLNVSRPPRERAEPLLAYLWTRPADVIVLTEVGRGGGSDMIGAVARASGFSVFLSLDDDLGVLVIGRGVELVPDAVAPPDRLPGRVSTLVAETGAGPIRIAGVYGAASDPVRYSSGAQRARKRDWLASIDRWLSRWLRDDRTPQVLIGDLNVVDPVFTAKLPYVLSEEVDAYVALSAEHDLIDAWRHSHPHVEGISWVDHSGVGCRYDHAFVTPDLIERPAECELDDTPRLEGLSDHSALSLRLS